MLGNKKTHTPKDYFAFHSHHPIEGSSGGSAIFVRRDIAHSEIPLRTRLQAISVRVHLKKTYTICSLYLPPNNQILERDLIDLYEELPRPFLILGDFNGRHQFWGDEVTNPRGNIIMASMENSDMTILNTEKPTHFHIQTGTLSCIDLSIASADSFIDFNWKVLDDLYGSDHFPIVITTDEFEQVFRAPRWCTDKANWPLFQELSRTELEVKDMPTVGEAIFYLTLIFMNAAEKSIPKTSGKLQRRPVPWWNIQCTIRHKAMRAAFTRYRRHRCDYYKICFKKARAKFRWQIKYARRESWMLFISTITWKTPMTKVWNVIRKIAGKFNPSPLPVLNVNGEFIADPKDVSNIFAEHFSKVSRKNESSPFHNERVLAESYVLDFTSFRNESYNLPFTLDELLYALANSKNTAPGPDEILYEMIKKASKGTQLFILSIINRIFKESDFPNVWEVASILPFLKPGKDSSLPTSYRPIALTSCVCKLMEKMVNIRLVWYLESKKLIAPSQCGFRRMHSCTDVLIRLEEAICRAFASKQHYVAVFFDLEKAYDTTWRYGILKALHEAGLRGELPLFIKAFLKNRSFKVKVGNTLSNLKEQEEGVPQGSVLSVTLFALAINGIASVIPKDIMSTMFVDDLSISFAASNMAVAERKLQLAINIVNRWASKHGFKFSSSKSVVMHFCRIKGVHPDPDLFLDGQRLSCVQETKFLGLLFDSRLTWDAHLKDLKLRCMKVMDALKVLAHTKWGADRKHLLLLYKSLVGSKLTYGSEVYSSANRTKLDTLNAVHHGGIRIATGAFRSSPIPSLLVDAGELPLDLIRKTSMIKYWFRIQRLPGSLSFNSVFKSDSTLYEKYVSYPKPFSYRIKCIVQELDIMKGKIIPVKFLTFPPWRLPSVEYCKWFTGFKANISDDNLKQAFLCHIEEHKNSIVIYTDGSKSDAGVGYGVVFPDHNICGALPSAASIFTAELFSILTVVKKLLSYEGNSFTVFSDSRSALQALSSFNPIHPLVLEILEWLFLLQHKQKVVRFCWVPAHVGVVGNELADQLAKSGVSRIPVNRALPCSDYVPEIKQNMKSVWQFHWTLEIGNKMREITDTINPWTYTCRERQQETTLCRLRIGHTRLTHGFLMNGNPQPFCEDCLVPLTIKHIFVECPSLIEIRNRCFTKVRGEDFKLSIILGSSADEDKVLRFLKEAGLLEKI